MTVEWSNFAWRQIDMEMRANSKCTKLSIINNIVIVWVRMGVCVCVSECLQARHQLCKCLWRCYYDQLFPLTTAFSFLFFHFFLNFLRWLDERSHANRNIRAHTYMYVYVFIYTIPPQNSYAYLKKKHSKKIFKKTIKMQLWMYLHFLWQCCHTLIAALCYFIGASFSLLLLSTAHFFTHAHLTSMSRCSHSLFSCYYLSINVVNFGKFAWTPTCRLELRARMCFRATSNVKKFL